jgi:porin
LAIGVGGIGMLSLFGPAAARAPALAPDRAVPASAISEPSSVGDRGLNLAVTYYGDAFDDMAGGLETGSTYEGRLGLIIDADLGSLVGWDGATAHASIHQIHGQGITPDHVGALMTVTGIEAEPTTRLFNLWVEQKFGDKVAVRVGQFTAGQEFFLSSNAVLFVNSTFGWPAILAQDLPSGGPAYPLATPGVRLSYKPNAKTTALAAIFNGDPAGPGGGDPQQRDSTGFNSFKLSGEPFLIAEVQHAFGRSRPDDPDTMIRVGVWYYLGEVADQRWDDEGRLLADPLSSGVPAQRRGDQGLYGIIDHVLIRGDRNELSVFLRGAISPSDRNLINCYVDGGISAKGLLGSRDGDLAGLAIAFSQISAGVRAHDEDAVRFSGLDTPIRDYEIAIEATYQAQITAHWSIQPDLQYIIHPGGGAGLPGAPAPAVTIPNAFVAGVRNVLKF